MSKIRPKGNRLLIRPLDVETQTAGGIFIPNEAQEVSQKGRVLAKGREVLDRDVLTGDVVYYSKGAAKRSIDIVDEDGSQLLIMTFNDLLGKM